MEETAAARAEREALAAEARKAFMAAAQEAVATGEARYRAAAADWVMIWAGLQQAR